MDIDETGDRIEKAALTVDFGVGAVPSNVIVGESERLRFATAFPVQTRPFTEAVFAHLASTSSIFTGLALFNPSDATVQVMIEVSDTDGHLLGSKSIHLEAGEQLTQLISELFPELGPRSAGSIRLAADEPIVGAEIFADWALNYYSVVPPAVISPISPISLISEGFQRIDVGGASGRDQAGNQ